MVLHCIVRWGRYNDGIVYYMWECMRAVCYMWDDRTILGGGGTPRPTGLKHNDLLLVRVAGLTLSYVAFSVA